MNPEDSVGQDKKYDDKDEGNAYVRRERVTVVSLNNKTIIAKVFKWTSSLQVQTFAVKN